MYYIDTHAHIYKQFYDNIDEIIKNMIEVDVKKVINFAEDLKTSIEVLNLQKKYPKLMYCAVGIHPQNAGKIKKEDIEKIENLIKNNKVCAIGEIGLDYHYSQSNKKKQIKVLQLQLKLAEKYNLPVILHCRDANDDVIRIIKKYNLKGVFHSFNGNELQIKAICECGFYIGINGIVTFKNAIDVKEMLKKIPTERLLLETDCPFLTPEPFRKYKNEPKYLPVTAEYVAKIKNITVDELIYIIKNNTFKIFDLDV